MTMRRRARWLFLQKISQEAWEMPRRPLLPSPSPEAFAPARVVGQELQSGGWG